MGDVCFFQFRAGILISVDGSAHGSGWIGARRFCKIIVLVPGFSSHQDGSRYGSAWIGRNAFVKFSFWYKDSHYLRMDQRWIGMDRPRLVCKRCCEIFIWVQSFSSQPGGPRMDRDGSAESVSAELAFWHRDSPHIRMDQGWIGMDRPRWCSFWHRAKSALNR